MKFQENVSLTKYSHYKIGGVARFFCAPKNEREVALAVREAKKQKLAIFVLAGGTNVLIPDEGFDGLVIHPLFKSIAVTKGTSKNNCVIKVGAGAAMADLLKFTAAKSLLGLEWAGGLPGTVGGAIRGNAGCFGGETKDRIVSVRSFDMKAMKFVTRTAAQCTFHYRDSVFKKKSWQKNGAEIILSATFRLAPGDKRAIAKAVREKIAYRERAHPLDYPNVGSIFKNIPLHVIHKKGSVQYKKAVTSGALTFKGSLFSVKTDPFPVIFAAKLIAETGLRGVSAGGAMISPIHTNFIVNVLDARSHDVAQLITLAKAEVYRKFKVNLEEEVQVLS